MCWCSRFKIPTAPVCSRAAPVRETLPISMGKLTFSTRRSSRLSGMIEDRLKQPVLTGKSRTDRILQFRLVTQGPGRNRPTDEAYKKSLAEMGLALDSDSESRQMMVWKKQDDFTADWKR